jgi:hypothetical protein
MSEPALGVVKDVARFHYPSQIESAVKSSNFAVSTASGGSSLFVTYKHKIFNLKIMESLYGFRHQNFSWEKSYLYTEIIVCVYVLRNNSNQISMHKISYSVDLLRLGILIQ